MKEATHDQVLQQHMTIELIKRTAVETARNMPGLAPFAEQAALGAIAAAYLELARAMGMKDAEALAKMVNISVLAADDEIDRPDQRMN